MFIWSLFEPLFHGGITLGELQKSLEEVTKIGVPKTSAEALSDAFTAGATVYAALDLLQSISDVATNVVGPMVQPVGAAIEYINTAQVPIYVPSPGRGATDEMKYLYEQSRLSKAKLYHAMY